MPDASYSNDDALAARKLLLAGLAIAVVGAILFSAKAIVAKLIYRYQVDAVTLIAFRMLFSLPFFAVIAIWQARQSTPLTGREKIQIIVLGLLGYYLSSFLDFLGLQYISAGLERLILFLTPSFVLLLSVFLMKRKITMIEWSALTISYLGTVLVFVHDVRLGGDNVALGGMAVLISAISYAVYLLASGELVKRVGSLRLVAYAMCVSSVACIAQFFVLRPSSMLIQPVDVYWLSLVNAVFCTVLPVFLTMIAVQRIGAATASQAGMIGPVSTLFLGAMLLDEPITGIQLAGTALVLCGVYLLSRKKAA
ncbi:DMT family transporter [Oxalicibacterium faecigallinarum]|uniref:Multidrug DMT transporter permease n=1 Tax=Oxalicibacterium faecigallinarum TaxID=573741 RepID=A0A8J3AVP0_9BURK|nr:DMT family transporter [Oxalicibacterium faecigallinarum]GGI21048.1 multidrug DMT transporter permease [Oxalicibacterium faecigallinarum]